MVLRNRIDSFEIKDYNTLLLSQIQNTGYAALLGQRFPDSIKKN